MSTFINRKEEVLEVKLTPYGKHLLSTGNLKPAFYAFFDSDIAYETPYFANLRDGVTGFKENQNDIVPRIKSTPRMKVQTNFSSLSGSNNNAQRAASPAEAEDFEQITPTNYSFMTPVGNSSPFSEYMPAWQIKTMSGSVGFVSSSYEGDLAIPTISSSVETKYSFTVSYLEEDNRSVRYFDLFEDQKILLDLQELNTVFKGGGNFEIEIFKGNTNSNLDRINRLSFINDNSQDADSLREQLDPEEFVRFLNGEEASLQRDFPIIDNSYVEYFLDVRIDDEIDQESIDTRASIYTNAPSGRELDPCRD